MPFPFPWVSSLRRKGGVRRGDPRREPGVAAHELDVAYEALAAGAAVVATGRSDFPNQLNNCLGFPGIFRGALDVRASVINEEMKLAAAYALAGLVPENELRADRIITEVMDERVVPAIAAAVAEAARRTGVARI